MHYVPVNWILIMKNIIRISIVRVLKLLHQGVVELGKCHLVPSVADVVGVVDTQHLLFVHPVWDAVEHVVHNAILCDRNVVFYQRVVPL